MSPSLSIDQKHDLAKKFEAILAKPYAFLFETLDDDQDQIKIIYAAGPLAIFRSLEELDEFIKTNFEKYKNTSAGFAGYLGYEGKLEFAFYENLFEELVDKKHLEKYFEDHSGGKAAYEILEPDPKVFLDSVEKCKEYIAEGDIYQANLTRKFLVKKNFDKSSSNINIYAKLRKSNPAPYSGYMNFTDYEIISSSPESFLKLYQNKERKLCVSSSPIKGSAGLDNRGFLEASEKDKAEHIMIVDLVRNDISRIARIGSVRVEEMLEIYKFKNILHYISRISGELQESLYKNGLKTKSIFDACFPGGSITGAPKIRAMEVIKELEPCSRELYTGSMGYLRFKDSMLEVEFNILIRSIFVNKQNNEIFFFSGGGITAYSDAQAELLETNLKVQKLMEDFGRCFDKAKFKIPKNPSHIHYLLETIKIENGRAHNLEPHYNRLLKSAQQLGFNFGLGLGDFCKKIEKVTTTKEIFKLRCILGRDGKIDIEISPYTKFAETSEQLHEAQNNKPSDQTKKSLKIKIIDQKDFFIDSQNPIWAHKFLPRPDFKEFLGDCDEIIWLNENGYICEGSFTNVFFRKDSEWFTPALSCGILPGTMRAKLIEELNAKEGHFAIGDLKNADEIRVSNSMLGFFEANL